MKNFLNPPSQIQIGQIWRCSEIDEDIIVTNTDMIKYDVVRAAVVYRIYDISDENDIVLQPDSNDDIYPTGRVILRLTDGPVSIKSLNYFIKNIDSLTLNKVKESIKTKAKPDYNPVQKKIVSQILEKIEPLHFAALKEYEEQKSKYGVNVIYLNSLNRVTKQYNYRMAAGGIEEAEQLNKFWRLERENKEQSLVFKDDKELCIRLSVVESHLYLVILSAISTKVSSICLQRENKIVESKITNFIIENSRGFTSFNENAMEPGEWELSMDINGKPHKYNFNLL